MSLDKWIKSKKEKDDKKLVNKNSQTNSIKPPVKSRNNLEIENTVLKKYRLNCLKKSCNYQKTVMKKNLSNKDLICPRCEGKMKINEI